MALDDMDRVFIKLGVKPPDRADVDKAAQQTSAMLLQHLDSMDKKVQGISRKMSLSFLASIAGQAKQFADEMIRTTNVFNSFTGSLEGMRQASQGQIRDFDLILARNRAVQMEFKPTEDQWEKLAAAADLLGDTLGTDAAEGLNQLVEAMATGKAKTLSHMGVVIDTEKTYATFAKTLGTTADRLTDEGKLIAFQQAAFEKLDTKLLQAGNSAKTFADAAETAFVRVRNAWDGLVSSLGKNEHLGGAVSFVLDNITATLSGKTLDEVQDERSNLDIGKINREAKAKAAADRLKRLGKANLPSGVSASSLIKPKISRGGGGRKADPLEALMDRAMSEDALMAGADSTLQSLLPKEDTSDFDLLTQSGFDQTSKQLDDLADSMRASADQARQFEAITAGAFNSVAAAGAQMAAGLSESLVAMLAGAESEAPADIARKVVRGLTAQSLARIPFEIAMGLSASARAAAGDPTGAAEAAAHFSSAKMFAAVAGAGAVGTALLGKTSAESSGRSATTSMAPRATGGFARTATAGGGDSPALVVNLNGVFLGDKAEIGRVFEQAVAEYEKKYGRKSLTR